MSDRVRQALRWSLLPLAITLVLALAVLSPPRAWPGELAPQGEETGTTQPLVPAEPTAEAIEAVAPPTAAAPSPTVAAASEPTPTVTSPTPVSVPTSTVPGPRQVSGQQPPPVTATYVAVVDEASGQVLYETRAHERAAPASITKIATTLVALQRGGDLNQVVPITISGSAMAARDGSSIMGLEPGRRVTLRTLLYGMMLPSGNDAAEQVALALAGSRERYVGWMNELVQSLGLTDTQFVTPSGMDARGHYSSAYDMAMLTRAAMANSEFRAIAAAATYSDDGFDLNNLNRLIGAYAGADGVKIGSTPAAGLTIVASATRNNHRVFVSLLRSNNLRGDSSALLDWAWQNFRWPDA